MLEITEGETDEISHQGCDMLGDEECDVEPNPLVTLTPDHVDALSKQNSRLLTEFKVQKFKKEAKKHWELFYKRNEDRFFKDRHWTTREFQELTSGDRNDKRVLLEIGCGVGNFVFPLLEEDSVNFFIYACDFSRKAVEIVKSKPKYDESKIIAFQADLTDFESLSRVVEPGTVDVISLVFVLSALDPLKFQTALDNVSKLLKPDGGLLMFRDYGLHDMAMFRFKPGTKVKERHYVRHDGTMTYFFTLDEMAEMAAKAGFKVEVNDYVTRRTINVKENIDVQRIFVQGKYKRID